MALKKTTALQFIISYYELNKTYNDVIDPHRFAIYYTEKDDLDTFKTQTDEEQFSAAIYAAKRAISIGNRNAPNEIIIVNVSKKYLYEEKYTYWE